MSELSFFNPEIYMLIALPLLIFISRVLDVCLGTIRIIFISKGYKYIAPIFGFFEVTVWLLAMAQIFQHLTSVIYYIAYAGGFAMGTFVGICIENKLSIGTVVIRIITRKETSKLAEALKSEKYEFTIFHAEDNRGQQTSVIFMVINRHDISDVVEILKRYNPRSFYSIEDVKFVSEKITSHKKLWYKKYHMDLSRYSRKGK